MSLKLIPVRIGDLDVTSNIYHKKYLRMKQFDEQYLGEVLATIFNDYHILKIILIFIIEEC